MQGMMHVDDSESNLLQIWRGTLEGVQCWATKRNAGLFIHVTDMKTTKKLIKLLFYVYRM
jgi:hypothetical protein